MQRQLSLKEMPSIIPVGSDMYEKILESQAPPKETEGNKKM